MKENVVKINLIYSYISGYRALSHNMIQIDKAIINIIYIEIFKPSYLKSKCKIIRKKNDMSLHWTSGDAIVPLAQGFIQFVPLLLL